MWNQIMTHKNVLAVKEKLVNIVNSNPELAMVGRISAWLTNSESRYPISCTVLSVEDTMEGINGIEYSWLYVSKALRYAAGVAVDLSKLRPAGHDNGKGLISSGVCYFIEIYSKLNEVLRRGGVFKNGAVVSYLDANHPDIVEYINYSAKNIPWLKRAVYVDANPNSPDYIWNNKDLLVNHLLPAMRNGSIWVVKKQWYNPETKLSQDYPTNQKDIWENRLYSQVCTEILLKSNATCLLSHVNLGMCKVSTIEKAFKQSMIFLCELHKITNAGKDNYYLPPSKDKQVGLGVIGLANILANNNISYKNFVSAFKAYLELLHGGYFDFITEPVECPVSVKVLKEYLRDNKDIEFKYKEFMLIKAIHKGYIAAAKIAKYKKYNMQRAFTIAPTVTCAFNYKDLKGYTTTQEISPPICHPETKSVTRDSDYFGTVEYTYPPNVETAENVGFETYFELVTCFQELMNSTGLAHAISFNWWNTNPIELEDFKKWLSSNLISTYYRMIVDQAFTDKSSVNSDLDINLAELSGDFFIPEDTEDSTCEIYNPGFCTSCSE